MAKLLYRRREVNLALARHGARNAYVFGSVARGTDTEESDIDIVVDFDAERFGLIPLTRLAEYLSTLLGETVHVAARSLLQDRMAALNGRTVEYVLKQDRPAFVRLIWLSVAQAAASAVLAPSLRAVGDSLALSWRRTLTAALHRKYLRGNNFYTVSSLAGVADVDARITADVDRLCADLAALIPTLVKPVFDLGWFSVQLYRLTGRRGMVVLYAYAALGFTALRALTPDFGGMARDDAALEGAFRDSHARLRAHAESVAFFGGGPREAETVRGRLRALLGNASRIAGAKWGHAVADDFFARQLPHNVTWALTVLYSLDHAPDTRDTAGQGRLVNDMRYLGE